MTNTEDARLASSTGHVLTESAWLDNHFLAMQHEYEEMLRWVGIRPKWHVLDAGCGAGSYLPLMFDLVGGDGMVSTIDLAPENVRIVEAKAKQYQWSNLVSADIGNVIELPYVDNHFDAVWCANTMQYLSEDEVHMALREFRRVVRPGGLVAVKDYDPTGQQYQPLPYTLCLRRYEALSRAGSLNDQALLRTIYLSQYLRAAGLVDIRQKPTLIVRFPPLRSVEIELFTNVLTLFAAQAQETDLPQDEKKIWEQLSDVDSSDHILKHPDFQFRAIQTVFVGRVP